jgi:hypothetical protein
MNLMTLIRLVAVMAVAWVLLAMGAGILGVGAHSTGSSTCFFWNSSAHDAVAVAHPEDRSKEEYRLVDRTTGRVEPLTVPPEEKWGLLSVSPWRDREGNLEAAGRWVSRFDGSENPTFCGLGIFRISDGTVLDRVKLDVLPTGRPCWIPGRPREFLFPGGDGQLYRCRLTANREAGTIREPAGKGQRNMQGAQTLHPVKWRCQPPGAGETFLADPDWSSDPRLHRFVIVTLRQQGLAGGQRAYEPSRIWWLKMNDDADAIVAAGRLTGPESSAVADDPLVERFPIVSAASDGRLTLIYLARRSSARSWQLYRTPLALDQKTGTPKLETRAAAAEILGEDLAPAPVIPLTDGQSVYASAAIGQIYKYPRPARR